MPYALVNLKVKVKENLLHYEIVMKDVFIDRLIDHLKHSPEGHVSLDQPLRTLFTAFITDTAAVNDRDFYHGLISENVVCLA